MVKILSPCVLGVEEQRKIFFSLFFLFQTFFSSHFLLVLFLFSEYAALVLALIPPDPPFVGLYWAQWSGFLSLPRLMSVCVCVCVHLSVHEKKRVGENERVFESVCVCVCVWVCGSLLAFQRPHIIFVRVFYLQSHCIHKVPVFALLARHFETFAITGLLWTWRQACFHSKKATRPTRILMRTHINQHTLTEGQFGRRSVWVNSVSP